MSRSSRVRQCPHCGNKTIVGLDADWAGITVTLDHTPVDNVGEFLAVATGRRTYELRPTSSRGSHGRVIEERNAHRIANADQRRPIHAEHRCGQPLPAAPAAAHSTSHPIPDVIIEGAPF